jgi:hypothetical protein
MTVVPRRVAMVTVVALAAGLAVAGCGSDAKVTETRDGRVTVQGKGKQAAATIQGDGSSVTYANGTVPAGFPSAVPLPKGATLGTTASGTHGTTKFFQLNYLPASSATRALDAYGTQLTGAGFTVTPGAGSSITATDGTWTVRAVAGTGTRPTLAVTVTDA